MSTPLAATARVAFHYRVNTIEHTYHAYVRNLQLVAGEYMINSRTLDENDLPWAVASVGSALAISKLIGDTTVGGITELQRLDGVQWVTIATHTPDAMGSPGVAAVNSSQVTLTLRTKNNHKLRVTVMETREGVPQKILNPTAGDAAFDNFIKEFTSSYTAPQSPYVWQVGRDDQFLATDPFIRASVYLNRKLVRRRGV